MSVGYNMNNYYDINAKEYIESTINCDMSFHYQKFLKYLPKTGKILDVGFGSGRDMIYFKSLGYEVEGIDTSLEFVKNMKEQGFNVKLESACEINFKNEFDGIWACASLLHIKREQLEEVIIKCINALKENGVLYCSFKYGDKEVKRDNRYFNYINEDIINTISKNNNLKIVELYKSTDVREERKNEEWINILLKENKYDKN